MAKIGIVLATYNGEKYLSQMLDSLIAQKRPADFIVAVDDGSKDSTPEILKSYEGRLPLQVTCLPQNTGHRAAFSKALELAAPQLGENDLIALADQDDRGGKIAAICASPSVVLAPLGLLQGRRAVCYPGMEAALEGITWDKAPVAVDGHVVTGNGPAAAAPFALTLVAQSLGRDKAVEVANGMLLPTDF